MPPVERQRRYRERMRQEQAATEVRRLARVEASREKQLLAWEQEVVARGVHDAALIDFRESSPEQIAQVIITKTRGDMARRIADALGDLIAKNGAARED